MSTALKNNTQSAFWSDIKDLLPETIMAITSLSQKSYLSVTNLHTKITWWSQRAIDYYGMDENYTLAGKENIKRSVHPDDLASFKTAFTERLEGKNLEEPWEYRVDEDGVYKVFIARARMIYDEDQNPFVLIIRYDNHGIADEVDPITGLHTEFSLNQHIGRLLEGKNHAGLLKIGLDQFSHINVMYGADFANKILNSVAQKLVFIVRNYGAVYRLSGAKYTLVFENITREDLIEVYSYIVDILANSVEMDGYRVPIKISGGAVLLESYMTDVNGVRSRLTYAMNHSRNAHHGELVIFNDEVCGNAENQLELISLIHQCATNHFEGFRLFYQPIADRETGKICGMEALLRWEMEPYGMVPPGVFIEWLEEDPCIFDLGNWILTTALTDVKKLREYIPHAFVNVNISAAQLERKEFRDSVLGIIKSTGAKPEELCMELTERCRNLEVDFLRQEVAFFHAQGIKIALDDFGTGNSSLSLVLELPFDELKIDMSFIKDIKRKPQNQAMVKSIVDYAKRTDTEVCIEGIENKEVLDYISGFGATWHQGYYYSKPVPIEQFIAVLEKEA